MINPKFDFLLFDMIGTTIKDSIGNDSLIIDCFQKAFSLNGIQVGYNCVNQQRGKSKRESIAGILTQHSHAIDLSNKIYDDFKDLLSNSLSSLTEIKGTGEIFELLKRKGIKLGLGSGLPKDLIIRIIESQNWPLDSFDYIGSFDEIGKGRPDPIMILDILQKFKIEDKSRLLKIGDTVVDIQEGKNAGVKTAVVLTGTQSRSDLERNYPDFIFNDINEIIQIL
jgi:phosphoglycolate phosphatase-like HAD superfamily hydrolase